MQTLKLTEARNTLSNLITNKTTVEISNPYGQSILIPKEEWETCQQQLEAFHRELVMKEMDLAEARNEKKINSEEVDRLLNG